MEKDLNRSVKILEDVLSTPGKGLFKKSFNKFNFSVNMSLAPHELEKMASSRYLYDDTMTSVLNDKTITGGVIQADSPWTSTVNSLYVEFFEILQGNSGSQDVLEVVSELGKCCSDALKVIRSLKSKVAVTSIDEEKWLEKERDTWRLLFILYQDRLVSQSLTDDVGMVPYMGRSEKKCVESLFKRESLVRECQLVIDWLEYQAAEKDDQVLHFSDSSVGWENTLHQLQSADTIAFESSRQIVDKLDPDVVHYQRKPLHDIDAEDEKTLNRKVFQEIRCGKLEEAQKLVRQCGHAWKAAIFEGWRLYHDPNINENQENDKNSDVDDGYEEMDSNELKDIEGSSNRDIWKIMALSYCKQDYISAFERASIGAFCGYIDAMLPVCPNWEDNLWAHMKSMVDIRVESEIRDCCLKDNNYEPIPEEYWSQRMSLNEVFLNLESSHNSTVREESNHPQHVTQKYIILDDINSLLNELKDWSEDTNVSSHFLRFSAHLVLFLDQIGQCQRRDKVEDVIKAYINRLMYMNETRMVAFYVSKLGVNSQVHIYAQHCEDIIDDDERREALKYAVNCGLDVYSITKQIVENIRNRPQEVDNFGNLQQKITDTDKLKISSLDWLTFDENQKIELIVQSNAIIFSFLTLGKKDAAQMAFNKLPSESIQNFFEQIDDKDEELNQIIKEHRSYRVYLDAHEAFNEWFKQVKSKPVEPEQLPETAQFPEKVAHQHRVSQYRAEFERWKLTTNQLAKITKALLYNVLLFPKGWLMGAKDSEFLRSIVIPEITMLLYSVLTESDMHEECLQLADILASEEHQLYKAFSKDKLRNFLLKICETSIHLTSLNKDPWGKNIAS